MMIKFLKVNEQSFPVALWTLSRIEAFGKRIEALGHCQFHNYSFSNDRRPKCSQVITELLQIAQSWSIEPSVDRWFPEFQSILPEITEPKEGGRGTPRHKNLDAYVSKKCHDRHPPFPKPFIPLRNRLHMLLVMAFLSLLCSEGA